MSIANQSDLSQLPVFAWATTVSWTQCSIGQWLETTDRGICEVQQAFKTWVNIVSFSRTTFSTSAHVRAAVFVGRHWAKGNTSQGQEVVAVYGTILSYKEVTNSSTLLHTQRTWLYMMHGGSTEFVTLQNNILKVQSIKWHRNRSVKYAHAQHINALNPGLDSLLCPGQHHWKITSPWEPLDNHRGHCFHRNHTVTVASLPTCDSCHNEHYGHDTGAVRMHTLLNKGTRFWLQW